MTTVNREGGFEFGDTLDVRLEGLTLRVDDVGRSIQFDGNKLGFTVEINKAPQFAMIRVGGPTGGTIGPLVHNSGDPLGSKSTTPQQRAGVHRRIDYRSSRYPVRAIERSRGRLF